MHRSFRTGSRYSWRAYKAAADMLGGLLDPNNIASGGESTVTDEERKHRQKKKGRGNLRPAKPRRSRPVLFSPWAFPVK
ncbi:hypothetical protein C5745_07375 [Sphingobacterium haloxyli]|uniref:Uncharacterized protein n=2 Tax=Sphingobacterium haloxyli TaxID=2100533 RepID=A0A2S9J4P5_9SPHI|nr:hypothetical protein C5745_07375 [Sphingobacterium haloxyli]